MIQNCTEKDFNEILSIINDGAEAYRGVIPADRWHDPYMDASTLNEQIKDGVLFSGYWEAESLCGVMGIQYKGPVTLIRHAYVRTAHRNKGIGGLLLQHLISFSKTPVLIGTWADASWAIGFYQKYGFRLLPVPEKNRLLKTYWTIPERQVETSVVLASADWISA